MPAFARGLDSDRTHRMTFLAPLLLLGLLLVPVLLGLYAVGPAPPLALCGPLHEPGPARQSRPAAARLATPRARRSLPRRRRRARPRPRPADDGRGRAARGRHRDPRHRCVRLDEGDRRRADPARCRQGGGARLHRPAARRHPGRHRRLRLASGQTLVAADRRPRRRSTRRSTGSRRSTGRPWATR